MSTLPLHMGSLHSVEVVLVVLLAVGPFLALAAVVLVARRREAREDLHDPSGEPPRDGATDVGHAADVIDKES